METLGQKHGIRVKLKVMNLGLMEGKKKEIQERPDAGKKK